MSLYEKTVYPQLAETITADELAIHFTPSEEEIEFTTKSARLPASRLSLLVLLKLFQKLHRFPNPDEVAATVVDHLRIQLRLGAAVLFEYDDPSNQDPRLLNTLSLMASSASRRRSLRSASISSESVAPLRVPQKGQ